MSKYFIIFFIIIFSNFFVTKIINFFNIEETFFKRIMIFMSLYYFSLFSINYFFPETFDKNIYNEKIKVGEKIVAKEEYDLLDLNYPINKNINLKKELFEEEVDLKNLISINLENLELFFDIKSASPILASYIKNKDKSFTLFDYSNDKIKPFLILNEDESFNDYYLTEKNENDEKVILKFLSENSNIKIQKEYLISKKNYSINLKINAKVNNKNSLRVFLPKFNSVKNEEIIPFFYTNSNEFKEISKSTYEKDIYIKPEFLGFKDTYFVSCLENDGKFLRTYILKKTIDNNFSDVDTFVLETKEIESNFDSEINWYFGPKKYENLKTYNKKAGSLSDIGWFSFFGKISLKAIEIIYSVVKNYGLAIFIFGFLLKLLTFPISFSSRGSLSKREEFMRKHKYIQEKYRNDKERLAQEQMELIKKYGFMPGGASFIANFIQIPFIFSLQRILKESIDFYEEPFFGWIKNIGLPDKFYILPLIFAILIYTKLSKTADTPMKNFGFLILSFLLFFIMSKVSVAMILFILSNIIFGQVEEFLLKKYR